MNRPLVFIAICYMAGIAAAEAFKIPLPAAAVLFALAAAASAIFWKKTDKTMLVLFFSLGMLMYSFQAGYFPKSDIRNYPDTGSIKSVEVLVNTMPEETTERIYFTGNDI